MNEISNPTLSAIFSFNVLKPSTYNGIIMIYNMCIYIRFIPKIVGKNTKNNLKYYKIYFKKVSTNIFLNIKNISTY